MAKSGDNIYGQYRSIFNHCDVFGQQRNGNRRKTQNKGYYGVQGHPRSSEVIEVGTSRKPICDFLLVIKSNWHPISYRFKDIAAYCSNFGHFAFLSHPLGVRDNVRCSSLDHWKARSGLPISDNWTFFARCQDPPYLTRVVLYLSGCVSAHWGWAVVTWSAHWSWAIVAQ